MEVLLASISSEFELRQAFDELYLVDAKIEHLLLQSEFVNLFKPSFAILAIFESVVPRRDIELRIILNRPTPRTLTAA